MLRGYDAAMAANSRHEGTDTPSPLVEAKLAVPSVGHRLVDRPRVRRALDAGRDASRTLVAAPAGYGKTTAVRDWCASLDAALAWVVLDADDNDPVLLWRYVATAVDRVRPGLGRGALRRLGAAGSPGRRRCGTCKKEISEAAGAVVNVEIPGEGADPQGLAEGRFLAGKFELAANGMTDAATRCRLTVVGSGVDGVVKMGAGVRQIVAAHEAGHMFGLGDEYTAPFSGTGKDLGDPVDADLGPKQGLPGAVSENSDTIMSVGQAVKPQHYATFLEALKHVTGMQEWAFGPPSP